MGDLRKQMEGVERGNEIFYAPGVKSVYPLGAKHGNLYERNSFVTSFLPNSHIADCRK